MEFRREAWAIDRSFVVIGIYVVFKAVRLNAVTRKGCMEIEEH